MRPIIQSKKHISQISQGTIAQAAVGDIPIAIAAEAPSTTPTGVIEGSTIKAVYVELWSGNASATVVGSYTCILYKNPSAVAIPGAGSMAALHDYANKKNILFTSQALLPPTDGGQIAIMKGWYKIPKGKQRMGLGDSIRIALRNNNATALDINFCGVALFKEYT